MGNNLTMFLKNYILRMESDSFLMIIDKRTGDYRNIYAYTGFERLQLKELAKKMERHPMIA